MGVIGFSLLTAVTIALFCLQGGRVGSAVNRQPGEAVREDVTERCPARHSPVASSQPFGMSFSSKVVREMEAPEEKDHQDRKRHV